MGLSRMPNSTSHDRSYYHQGALEAIDVLGAFFPTDPLLWQVGKYILRAGRKPGNSMLGDLEKAADYLARRIHLEELRLEHEGQQI
jgi:hypothetical protein